MKNFLIIGFLISGYVIYTKKSAGTPANKNKEISQTIDKHFSDSLSKLKSKPNISDVKVSHDKKKNGIVIKVKLKSQPHHHVKLNAKCSKSILLKDLGNKYELKRDLLKLLQSGVYIRYRFYYADGSMRSSFDFNESDFD